MKYFSDELKLGQVDEMDCYNELWEEFYYDVDEIVLKEDLDIRYRIERNCIQVPVVGIDIHYAVVEILEEDNEWEISHDTMIFTKCDTYEVIYYENSSMIVSLHNYLNIIGNKSCSYKIEELPCYLMKK